MEFIESIKKVLQRSNHVIFAYLYGSFLDSDNYKDIDIAIYIDRMEESLNISSDLKFALSTETGLPPDRFDIQVINQTDNLLYLRKVLDGELLVDNDMEKRGDFLEAFSMRYREAEGILSEAYTI